jgi:hypothetical protein
VSYDNPDGKSFVYNWSLPGWIDLKSFNSAGKILTAFLDQILVIRYNLYLHEKDKFIFSLMDTGLDSYFNDKEILENFLPSYIKLVSKENVFLSNKY